MHNGTDYEQPSIPFHRAESLDIPGRKGKNARDVPHHCPVCLNFSLDTFKEKKREYRYSKPEQERSPSVFSEFPDGYTD